VNSRVATRSPVFKLVQLAAAKNSFGTIRGGIPLK
jgi:hypothetical protein